MYKFYLWVYTMADIYIFPRKMRQVLSSPSRVEAAPRLVAAIATHLSDRSFAYPFTKRSFSYPSLSMISLLKLSAEAFPCP